MSGLALMVALFPATAATADTDKPVPPGAAIPSANLTVDRVEVRKAERVLRLMHGDIELARFHIALGTQPVGAKQRQGDHRTPEGRYLLDFQNPHSAFFRSLHVSYPNREDRARARREGVPAGGDIMVHGQPNGYGAYSATTQQTDWTDGCIALTDEDMQVVWDRVPIPTPIDILP